MIHPHLKIVCPHLKLSWFWVVCFDLDDQWCRELSFFPLKDHAEICCRISTQNIWSVVHQLLQDRTGGKIRG